MGSGSTGIASHLEGFNFLGIERELEFFKIAQSRLEEYEEYEDKKEQVCLNEEKFQDKKGQVRLF
jgi:DNA modification methylase